MNIQVFACIHRLVSCVKCFRGTLAILEGYLITSTLVAFRRPLGAIYPLSFLSPVPPPSYPRLPTKIDN